MKGARGWIVAVAVAVAIAGAAYLLQPKAGDSPEHSTNSDAANGTSAALLFAQAMGHPVNQILGTFELPQQSAAMFVFSPTSQYTADDAYRTKQWVMAGGTLIYASEQGDPELDAAFGVVRLSSLDFATTYDGLPVIGGVRTVDGGGAVPLDPATGQVSFLRTPAGYSVGFLQHLGLGTLYVLADPLVLCNGYLARSDNGRLLADLLGTVDPTAPVAFDEYHHGLTVADFGPQSWLATPWGVGVLWLVVAVFLGLLLRGRRFGPLMPRPAEMARSDAEWSVAVGELLRRSSARNVTLGLLASAAERAVALRTGLSLQPRERFWNALWVRAPEVARDLADLESSLGTTPMGERDVLRVARRLHEIAHPSPRPR